MTFIPAVRVTKDTATTMPVNFCAWWDTEVTWLALAGVDVAKMMRRAGDDEIATMMGYVKWAEDVTRSICESLPALTACLVTPQRNRTGRRLGQVERRSPEGTEKRGGCCGEGGI